MYNMGAEQMSTGNGPGLLWHALDRDGSALCGRLLNGKATATPDGAEGREDYCPACMRDVAAAVGAQRGDRRA